ncbi:MAG: tRNA threonylcarbamoyladenosine dehydratase [Bacilli bacterium]|nr:tRNA threonylcarbamoyladenosine dehydratase [Bacilli bacterium]
MFERMISLIGRDKFSKLQTTNVLVVGIGGVGGYALEALARSGIMNISIIDYDKIEITNLNRQIITSNDNIGLNKVDVAKERVIKINPDIKITIFNKSLNKDNIDFILENKYDYIIDACDTIDTKVLIIEKSLKYKFKLISCMGTANKTNPALLSITELSKTSNDPIAKILRKKIKTLKINKKIYVVSSTEMPIANKILGTNSYIPGIAGLLCASYVINDITKK